MTKFGTHNDLETPCYGCDFGSKMSKIKVTGLQGIWRWFAVLY